jgi:hypothetical protein
MTGHAVVGTASSAVLSEEGAALTALQPRPDRWWTTPQKPVRIHGNTWHVGPRGLFVFLMSAPTGHVPIDGGVLGLGQHGVGGRGLYR